MSSINIWALVDAGVVDASSKTKCVFTICEVVPLCVCPMFKKGGAQNRTELRSHAKPSRMNKEITKGVVNIHRKTYSNIQGCKKKTKFRKNSASEVAKRHGETKLYISMQTHIACHWLAPICPLQGPWWWQKIAFQHLQDVLTNHRAHPSPLPPWSQAPTGHPAWMRPEREPACSGPSEPNVQAVVSLTALARELPKA